MALSRYCRFCYRMKWLWELRQARLLNKCPLFSASSGLYTSQKICNYLLLRSSWRIPNESYLFYKLELQNFVLIISRCWSVRIIYVTFRCYLTVCVVIFNLIRILFIENYVHFADVYSLVMSKKTLYCAMKLRVDVRCIHVFIRNFWTQLCTTCEGKLLLWTASI